MISRTPNNIYISEIAKFIFYPNSAFVVVSKSLQNKWSFIQRALPTDEHCFVSLKEALCHHFLPATTGFDINTFDAN